MGTTPNQTATPARDRLTGLYGPGDAHTTLGRWQADYSARGHVAPIQAMLLGLGRFDTVNLAYGEAAGDGALAEVARRILHFAEDEFESGASLVARIGGGQFLVAALEACSRERWEWLADALADAVALPIADLEGAGTLRLWPRVALMRATHGEGPEIVVDRLAQALAQAQAEPARRVLWADGGLSLPGRRSAQLEADLLAALDRDEIEVLYQPQFSLVDERLTGAEALARWQHPEIGRIGAGALFAIAERADHVAQLSRHIATRALAGAAGWPGHLRLSLNITPADLAAGSFAQEFSALLGQSGFPAERLTLEITEQVLLADIERAAASLDRLHALGIRIALDDFGAGFCNFRYLKLLPLDYLKLDRAMVDGVSEDSRDLAVLRGIVAMAKALDLQVIAEGIENEAQRAIIAAEGCDYYQGFLRATPMGAGEFAEFAGR
ncbi:MAG: EAL domain-containing protein [Sphingomonadales bacterium]|nr:EAL domain-containing protein [Sphingomonadales bacterium]MBD3774397.1 EAL domain-containing protein [Paracoccaceae bacterium]